MGTIQIDGSTPKLTIGNATAEDALILFDGNAQDFHIGLDDTADDLVIGVGSALGTTTALAIDENANSTFSGTVTVGVDDTGKDVKFFGATASAYMLWDESADDLILAGAAGLSVAGATATAALTASGIIKTDDTTEATSTTDGSLQTDGGLSVVKDTVMGDDLKLLSDGAVIHFGADSEVTLTHANDTGLTLNYSFTAANSMLINGTTPTLTIGDAGAEDAKIVFDGNAQDFHIGLDDTDDDLKIGLGSTLGTTSHIVIDEAGHVTKPLQSAFLALNDGSDSITNATTTTIALDSEVFDVNGDVASNTFTAPVTGKYYLSGQVRVDAGTSSVTRFNRIFMSFNASNRGTVFETGQMYTDEDDRMGVTGSLVLDMDANDTVVMRFFASRNGATDAVTTSGNSTEPVTFFSGYLLG